MVRSRMTFQQSTFTKATSCSRVII